MNNREGQRRISKVEDTMENSSTDGKKPKTASSTSSLLVEDLTDDISPLFGQGRFALYLHNVYTKEECAELIQKSESVGYDDALVNIGQGRQKLMKDIRNNDRCIVDDAEFAEDLFQRILARLQKTTADEEEGTKWEQKFLHPNAGGRRRRKLYAVGCNERLRFLRYDPGTFFAPHMDGAYIRPADAGPRAGETSYVTVQLYLNEGFEGGATRFMRWEDADDHDHGGRGKNVVPKTGSVLVFEHDLCHEGSILVSGRKYAMRTDVMYTDKEPTGT